ncbi:hypothetical protein BCR43DRAFT_482849 [Syncephalastrum racemosum]|uniref:WH1 domain-domain-containing protein n=1 Tax=Syncephalastrum racemosum TaxID=13706 RepID=A0A1X2HUJ7_SYNRA|nr:hypothetical protein BCR43DRAFT_482849 [Syncephalastrum racemosum]
MPSATLPSQTDKDRVRNALPTSKILTAAVARLFVAYPNPSRWSYTHLWGAAALCKDKNRKNSYFIRLVDIEDGQGILWEQELFKGFQLVRDAPFFYSFETDDCLAGLEFVEPSEADSFFKKLLYRETIHLKGDEEEKQRQQQQESAPTPPLVEHNTTKHTLAPFRSIRSSLRKRKVDKTAIGGPSAFKHREHVGFTPGKGFSVQEGHGDSSGIISQLQSMGVSADEISRNKGFIDRFLEDHNVKQQAAPPLRAGPPPRPPARRPPPPPIGPPMTPPPPRTSHPPVSPIQATTQQARPPPLPERHPSPVRPVAIHPAPAPAPAASPLTAAPPPPPPPPPPPRSAPPVASSAAELAPVQATDGRADLMASIRGTGGFGHLKQSGHLRKAEEPVEEESAAASHAVEGSIISSLADALKHRKAVMDSDEEEESDDEWD